MDTKINELVKKNKGNKLFALIGVILALLLSSALIYHGMRMHDSKKPVLNNITITKYVPVDQTCTKQYSASTTTCCNILPVVECVPTVVTEKEYNNTANVLLCISTLVFIILVLWGTFTFLFKVLKSEHEINSKVLSVELDIYKEEQMRQIADKKNDKEYNDKIRELNSAENQRGLKYLELKYKKKEFDELEKVKQEFEHNLKVNKQDGDTETKPSDSCNSNIDK